MQQIKHSLRWFIIVGFFCAQDAHAEIAERRFLNGHNLSITSDTLEPGRCALGLDISACGITDSFSLGTSTWMWMDYNMASLAARYRFGEDDRGNLWAVQFSYFQTYRARNEETFNHGTYQMRSLWAMLVRTWAIEPHYRLHLNFHANYYGDEKMPFSLRRPASDRSPYQLNITTLHEMNLTGAWYVFGEVGLLDFARAPLHLHFGSSIGQAWRYFEWHLGFSLTGTNDSLFSPVFRYDVQQYLRSSSVRGYDDDLSNFDLRQDFAIHPEFSLQFLF